MFGGHIVALALLKCDLEFNRVCGRSDDLLVIEYEHSLLELAARVWYRDEREQEEWIDVGGEA